MSVFTEQERAFLAEARLGRLATVDAAGRPHVVPVGFRLDPDGERIAIGGHNLAGTKKFRDASRNPHAAIVIDDLVSTNPWTVRGIEVRGIAETFAEGGDVLGPGFGGAWIRITPERIVAWGIEPGPPRSRSPR
jgi:pyridoxamine 5'-phosphate oxidase family protein